MDLSGYEVPRVLVTRRRRQIDDDKNVPLYYYINKDFSIPFGREKFCLVTGLRFGVQNWAEYDTKERIPFRRRAFPSYLDGQPITGIDIINMIVDQSFAQLYDDDAVGLCCLGILQLVILGVESRRVVPDWILRLPNDRAFKTWILESFRVTAIRYFDHYNRYPRVAAWSKKKGRFLGQMVIPFFQGNMPAARLTPDDNEARSDWWISSKAYFDGFIGQLERVPFDLSRQNMYEIPSDIYREFDEQKREFERNKKEVDNIKEKMRKFRQEMNVQPGGPSSFQGHVPSHIGRPNLQTTIETHHDVDGIFDQGKKANLSPLNLGGAFEDDNVEENNVTFLGSQFTGNFLMYENVDPTKVRRVNYVNFRPF
ncbi:hypothetical protein Tco_0841537 [Tanacetum coccineum]|uniref:Aminotransferase-like plant mobile domain-containing protein n=1 Tax=Tanacetum coccineum TaxID=301880 RepID=A0ABQ5AXB5_9ASTR